MTTHFFLKSIFRTFDGSVRLQNFQERKGYYFFTFSLYGLAKSLLSCPFFPVDFWTHIPTTDCYILCVHRFQFKSLSYLEFSRYLKNNSAPF